MSNILITLHPNDTFIFNDVAELDICNHSAVKQFIVKNEINIIINCAAYTAVDKAEEQEDLANAINHLAVKNFASIAKEFNIKLIHISTDYVFDGTNHVPYQETDKPNPQSVYGQTKLDGELAIQKINPGNTIIIRTSWVYSNYGNNFLKTMLRLAETKDEISVVADQIGSPTNFRTRGHLLRQKTVEIFHYSNEGVCSWYDFANVIFEIKGVKVKVNAIETFQYPTAAKRPSYSVLNKSKIKSKFEVEISFWRDSLISCLKQLNNSKNSRLR